jgi:hypothetical protein
VVGRPKSAAWSVRPDQLRRALVALVMGRRGKRLRSGTDGPVDEACLADVGCHGVDHRRRVSAHAALRALSARNVANDRAVAASSGRVPGTTELSSSERETGALATGVTGTIDLPDLPIPAGTMVDVGVVATQPFSMAGASLADRDRAMQCLTAAIYYEAASEPDAGQQAWRWRGRMCRLRRSCRLLRRCSQRLMLVRFPVRD